MLIDGQKWACEPCIRGHRVASCKHHDRPLIRIKRKGRPFATCSICHATPCESPTEHTRLKREAELKSPSKKASHARLYPRHHNLTGFLPIAPRPAAAKDAQSPATPSRTESGSASASSSHTPLPAELSSRHGLVGVGDWSGSESSGRGESTRRVISSTTSETRGQGSSDPNQLLSHATLPEDLFPGETPPLPYSLAPSSSSSVSDAQLVQTMPLVSPPEGTNPFDIPLDPTLALDDGRFGYLEDLDMDMDMSEGLADEVFHVEDWSRYMWSPETGFEHLDTGVPPGST